MAIEAYTATIQFTIHPDEANSVAEACDWISGLFSERLRGRIIDWEYAKVGKQYLYPTKQVEDFDNDT